MNPEDLKNKSKGNSLEAVYSKGGKEKWIGSWRRTWGEDRKIHFYGDRMTQ